MRRAFLNGRVLTDTGWVNDRAVLVEDGRISALPPRNHRALRGAEQVDLGGDLLLPGFIDTQVNGGGGVLFNSDPTLETIRKIGAAHRRFGTTGFLGGLTTFSAFSGEATALLHAGRYGWAALHIGSHLAGSIVATIAGIETVRRLG